jgi:O-acetyl-ADP-ribose deacetylase
MPFKVEVVRGSLLEQDVEAIVNAANTSLRGGGGIDGAIHRAAGPDLVLDLMRRYPGGCKTGEVVVSSGFNTGFKYIFHTPGPYWHGGHDGEEEALLKCYVHCAMKAADLEIQSIGFCSISTGIYRFPLDRAAPIAMAAVKTILENSPVKRVVFAMFREEEFAAFTEAHLTVFPPPATDIPEE